jgi:hypothetical protein
VIPETKGRRSGKPRRVPLAPGPVDGWVGWVISVHGEIAAFVRNMRVRSPSAADGPGPLASHGCARAPQEVRNRVGHEVGDLFGGDHAAGDQRGDSLDRGEQDEPDAFGLA